MSGSDGVGGKAVALGINCTATAQNDATVTNAMGAALAGNDISLSEDGNDVLAGDALASGIGGTATADNIAAVVGSGDGDITFLPPLSTEERRVGRECVRTGRTRWSP